jgi:exopolysaccharide biosynthesis protein
MAITGSSFLLTDGVVQVVDDTALHPRTAVGVDRDAGQVLLLVVDGRSDTSRGATLVELANLMLGLGADEALNLDGGGSSTLVGRRPAGGVRVLNTPSDGSQRHVSNALEVTYTPPA